MRFNFLPPELTEFRKRPFRLSLEILIDTVAWFLFTCFAS